MGCGCGTAVIILLTMSTSTSLILSNKYLMTHFHFDWPVSLSSYHFFVTYGLLEVMLRLKFFDHSEGLPSISRWLLGFYNSASIVLMNFNLRTNSIGFYQLSKLATIPFMVLINFFLYKKKTPVRTLFSLVVLLCGLYLFSVNDVQFNFIGCIFAIFAVATTTASQLYNGQLQKEFNMGGTSLQHQTAFPMAFLAILSAVFLEMNGNKSILKHEFSKWEAILALGTGIIAVGSNVSAFAIIGRTSAITYQVIGHVKTLIIFVVGLMLFPPDAPEPLEKMRKKMLGLALGMVGTVLYTTFEMMDKNRDKNQKVELVGKTTDNRIGVDIDMEAIETEENLNKEN